MKTQYLKNQYLTGLVFVILALIALMQIIDNTGPVRTATANQASTALELPNQIVDLVAFSPDGNSLATVDPDGQIMLWDVASGKIRKMLPSQFTSLVNHIVFSPDNNTLVSVSDDSIRLWDLTSGDVRLVLPVANHINDLVFSPDAKTLAAVAEDAGITLWDSQSGSIKHTLTGQSGVNALIFSPDSRVLATGGEDALIKLWDVATGTEQTRLPGENDAAVTDLEFSPDGKILAAVGENTGITLWDLQSDSIKYALTSQSGVKALVFSPDNTILATGDRNAQVKLWDMATGMEKANLPGESGTAITELLFSPDGKTLASVGESETVFLWDIASQLPQVLTGHQNLVVKAVFNSDEMVLASVDKIGQVIVWDRVTGSEQLAFQVSSFGAPVASTQGTAAGNSATTTSTAAIGAAGQVNGNSQNIQGAAVSQSNKILNKKKSSHNWKGVTALAISPDGRLYGGANEKGEIRLWTSSTGKERFAVSGHHGAAVTGVVFSADGGRLVTVGRDTELQTRDVATGKEGRILSAHEHPIRAVAASPDGKYFASAGEETRIMLWDAQADKLIRIFSGGHTDFVNAVSFSADGKELASAGADGRILLWDVETGRLVLTLLGHSDEVNAVTFSPNGKFVAGGGADNRVILWDAITGQQIQSFSGHQAAVRAVAFSPNGQTLASAGEDTQILAWNPVTGKLVNQIAGAKKAINALVFGPIGNLIAGSDDGEITEWDVNKGQILKTIKTLVQPLSNNSETFPGVSSMESVPAGTGQIKQPISTPLATVTLSGIFNRVLDWLIPSAEAAIPNPSGGPILVVTTSSATFGQYYAEILRTEGFNEFATADISTVNATTLTAYDVVILAPGTLTSTQVTAFSDWVNAGGNLIAMRPDVQLAGLLGLTSAGSTLANGYLLVDTSRPPGNGIVNQTMQFHGTADRYNLNGATSLATLYSNASTATTNPALTLRNVGTNGGQAAAFTYDLATSIVYTRQGNPAWATQERDGFSPIRSDDKFYGNATGDPQQDWVDFNKIAIPQADEQQRLLANLILEMNRDKKPLPRFWYFPRGEKAVVIMTGDDHGNNGTAGRFDQFKAMSPAGCSVANWECVRGTSYIYPSTPLTNEQAAAYNSDGFEVGLHVSTSCGNYTLASLRAFYSTQISDFTTKYLSIPAPITQRHHCIAWSDWVSGAIVQLENGIRFDTSYYFWPPSWVLNRPGFFSGTGMAMRFVDLNGSMIDVYHVTSQMTDESGQTYPFTIDTLLDRALGTEGYYGAYTINAHTDVAQITEATTTVNSALARGVPIVSSKQMLDWLDARNSSSFGSFNWSANSLSFTVAPGAGANGLQVLLPMTSPAGILTTITRDGAPITFTTDVIKGVSYGAFSGTTGLYVATYAADATAPTVTSKSPADGATGVSLMTSVTATFSEAMDAATINGTTFELRNSTNNLVAAAMSYNASTRTATLTPNASLAASTTYTVTVKGGATDPRVKDLAGNALSASVTWSFTTAAQPCAGTPCSSWSSSTIPGTPSVNDPNSVELGVKFRSDLDGFITGIRFYQVNAGTYTGTLWSTAGQQLATGNVTATASGWQQVTFSAPVAITANTVYVASYHAQNGNYAADNLYFSNAGVDNVPIHLLQDGVIGGNGVYAYSGSTTFPSNTYQSSNYWVDVVFNTSTGPDTTTPTVTAQSPAAGATNVAANTSVTATFSEAVDAATITTSTFELRDASNGLVSVAASYDATSRVATLTPNSALAAGATYTATVKGGTTDPRVKDLAGNALASNFSWSFTTAAEATAGCSGSTTSIWPSNPTPAILADSDTASVELGVKFRSTQNGYICGIRFYKGSGNTGTHIGKLWSSSGTLLASANFQNETTSGWQQVNFASPVQIVANQQYVASYLAPAGRYSANNNYFTAGVTSGPLYALNSTESGGNGVYQYGSGGFPTSSYQASNYWVDVVFTTSIGPDTTPPNVSSTLPTANATGVVPASPVTVTFSEAMDAATINNTTFELRNPANVKVSATVSYNAATNTATLTPTAALAESTQYTAKVISGGNGVKDSAGIALAADFTWSFTTGVDPCSTGGNPIVCENSKIGNPASEWDISGAGDPSIQGYATDISVNRGQTVKFKINTPSTNYLLDIYRMGYYAGNGARKIATVEPSATLPQSQPSCLNNTATGLIDCGNWSESASWLIPADAVSGIYFAKAVREDGTNTGASHIVFIVRDDASTSDLLFQTADTTWQAYNTYGGNSFYTGSPEGRAYKISYNRPFNTRSVDNGQDWLFNAEYPMVRWLEANGYNVSYFTGVDADRFGNLIKNHKIFLSVGHDEYWSKQQWENVEKALDNLLANQVDPVNLAFFSGNEVFWKTRWENNITNPTGSLGTDAYRTLVCYKETHANAKIDPSPEWTGTWRDPRFSPPADGGRPENQLTGTIFTVNDGATTSIRVPEADGKMRFWRNTSAANLTPGSIATLPNGTLGYEWDEDLDNGFRPGGLMRMSTTTVPGAPVLLDYGSTYGSGTAVHSLTMYRARTNNNDYTNKGALVFGAGTVQWAWGLDSNHDRAGTPTDANMQQATVNLFADMGVQPNTLQAGLVAATASTDTTAPASTITSPVANSNVSPGSTVTITGTATDAGGGRVGGVEVSVDGGVTWHPATGRSSWTYIWTTPGTSTTATIRSRAVDDSLNLETPTAGIIVTVGTGVDTQAPTVPGNLTASVTSGTQITLNWTASTDNVAVTGYRIERCQDAGCSNFTEISSPTTTSYADSALTEGNAYRYRVRAVDGATNLSSYSAEVTAVPDATAPSAPSVLIASAVSGTQINLNWTASTDNVAVTGYQVERCQGTGCTTFAQIATPTTVSYTDSSVASGTLYRYRVRAVDAAPLLSGYSNIAEITTNSVPVAVNDTFLYRANVLRTVNAPGPLGLGVLANDTHSQNLPLTAQLLAGSLSDGGTLNLAADGSFTYLRATGSDTVSFRYRASDGSSLSEPATGATVNMRVDAAPTTTADNCSYDRSANSVTEPARCTVTAPRTVKMNVVLNDTDSNVTTNVPMDSVGMTVVPSTMVVTAVSTAGVAVIANENCGQSPLGTSLLLATNATIENNCDGTLTITMTLLNTSNINYSYRVSDDLGAQSSARSVRLSSVK